MKAALIALLAVMAADAPAGSAADETADDTQLCATYGIAFIPGFEAHHTVSVKGHLPGVGSSEHCRFTRSSPGRLVVETMVATGEERKFRGDRCYWSCREVLYRYLGRQDWSRVGKVSIGGRPAWCVRVVSENPALPVEEFCRIENRDGRIVVHSFATADAASADWIAPRVVARVCKDSEC